MSRPPGPPPPPPRRPPPRFLPRDPSIDASHVGPMRLRLRGVEREQAVLDARLRYVEEWLGRPYRVCPNCHQELTP